MKFMGSSHILAHVSNLSASSTLFRKSTLLLNTRCILKTMLKTCRILIA